jgi:hypothetical protein
MERQEIVNNGSEIMVGVDRMEFKNGGESS